METGRETVLNTQGTPWTCARCTGRSRESCGRPTQSDIRAAERGGGRLSAAALEEGRGGGGVAMTASEPGQYRKVEIRRFPARALRETAEGRYWRAFQPPLTAPQAGAVTHIDVCPTAPHHFAATASTRVRRLIAAAAVAAASRDRAVTRRAAPPVEWPQPCQPGS